MSDTPVISLTGISAFGSSNAPRKRRMSPRPSSFVPLPDTTVSTRTSVSVKMGLSSASSHRRTISPFCQRVQSRRLSKGMSSPTRKPVGR